MVRDVAKDCNLAELEDLRALAQYVVMSLDRFSTRSEL